MGLFRKSRQPALDVQMRNTEGHPFGMMNGYSPLRECDGRVYRSIREAIPMVDAAIMKLIRLTGGFTVGCEGANERDADALRHFVTNVDTGRAQKGLASFLESYLDSLLTTGRAVGEIVLDRERREIAAVLCGNPSEVTFLEGGSQLDFSICRKPPFGGVPEPFPNQELLLFTPLNPEPNNPYGVSLLHGMPFMADILMKIYQATGQNWERAGNVRFAVVYKPSSDILDRSAARERGEQIAAAWANAMKETKSGSIRDFVAVGDVDVRVIGADGQVLDSQAPVRQILEQLLSRIGIPPFMLGLSWSTTERMSSQQADIMTSEITALRRTLTPVLEKICALWLRMRGIFDPAVIEWETINLQDEVEEARARLLDAQAKKLQIEMEGSDV